MPRPRHPPGPHTRHARHQTDGVAGAMNRVVSAPWKTLSRSRWLRRHGRGDGTSSLNLHASSKHGGLEGAGLVELDATRGKGPERLGGPYTDLARATRRRGTEQ